MTSEHTTIVMRDVTNEALRYMQNSINDMIEHNKTINSIYKGFVNFKQFELTSKDQVVVNEMEKRLKIETEKQLHTFDQFADTIKLMREVIKNKNRHETSLDSFEEILSVTAIGLENPGNNNNNFNTNNNDQKEDKDKENKTNSVVVWKDPDMTQEKLESAKIYILRGLLAMGFNRKLCETAIGANTILPDDPETSMTNCAIWIQEQIHPSTINPKTHDSNNNPNPEGRSNNSSNNTDKIDREKMDRERVSILMAYGFSEEMCKKAIKETTNMDSAIDWLTVNAD